MERLRRMFLLLSTGLAAMACQGCASHIAVGNGPAISKQGVATATEPSEGLRLAVNGAFEASFAQPARQDYSSADMDVTLQAGPLPAGPLPVNGTALTSRPIAASPQAWLDPMIGTTLTTALNDTSWSSSEGVQAFEANLSAARLIEPLDQDKRFAAGFEIAANAEQTGLGFDLSLAPSLAYAREGDFRTRRVGAEVRLGQNFDQRGQSVEADSWYIFAGQEGEAIVWEAGEYGFSDVTDAMALRDQVTVGDLQAGISVQRGQGQLSFSYIRREVEYQDRNGGVSENEDFAGISFTVRK